MMTWTFRSGTQLRSGGLVTGSGAAADLLRCEIERSRREPVYIPLEHPDAILLDADDDESLHYLAEGIAFRVREMLCSEYVPRERYEYVPGRIY